MEYAVSADVNNVLRFEFSNLGKNYGEKGHVALCCRLYQDGEQLAEVNSGYTCVGSLGSDIRWRVIFPVKVRDLSSDAQLHVIVSPDGSSCAVDHSCVIDLFGPDGLLRQGKINARLDGYSCGNSISARHLANYFRVEKVLDLYQRGCVTPVSWPIGSFLDGLQNVDRDHYHANSIAGFQFPVFAAGNSTSSLLAPTSVLLTTGRYNPESVEEKFTKFSGKLRDARKNHVLRPVFG